MEKKQAPTSEILAAIAALSNDKAKPAKATMKTEQFRLSDAVSLAMEPIDKFFELLLPDEIPGGELELISDTGRTLYKYANQRISAYFDFVEKELGIIMIDGLKGDFVFDYEQPQRAYLGKPGEEKTEQTAPIETPAKPSRPDVTGDDFRTVLPESNDEAVLQQVWEIIFRGGPLADALREYVRCCHREYVKASIGIADGKEAF